MRQATVAKIFILLAGLSGRAFAQDYFASPYPTAESVPPLSLTAGTADEYDVSDSYGSGFSEFDVDVDHSSFWDQLNSRDEPSILLTQGTSPAGGAGGGGGGGGDLAAKSQNPISDLVSLPIQNNWDFGIEPGNRTQYIGNLQPVVPVKLNEDWNLINRVIVPFVNVPTGPDLRAHGIGNIVGQFFFSPREPSHIIWGVGPAFLFPTASDPAFGPSEWGAGVDGVILYSESPIVTGLLISQIWGVNGDTKPFLLQPFFNYNLPQGWFLSASGEANADWERPEDSRWTFPLGGGVGRVFPLFGQPMNINTRFAPFLKKPPGGPDWEFRVQVTFLFPK